MNAHNGPVQAAPDPLDSADPSEASAREVIGTLLLNGERVPQVTANLEAADFSNPIDRAIYGTLVDLSRRGTPIDFISVWGELGEQGRQGVVGSSSALAAYSVGVISPQSLTHHAGVVATAATKRRAAGTARRILADVEGARVSVPGDLDGVLEGALSRLQAATTGSNAAAPDDLPGLVEAVIDKAISPTVPGMATGLHDLDDLVGGFQPGELIVAGAPTSGGKTTVCCQVALNAARDGRSCLVASVEMSSQQIVRRFLANLSGVHGSRIRRGAIGLEDGNAIRRAGSELASMPIEVFSPAAPALDSIEARARNRKARKGLDLLVVDYLQLIAPSSEQARHVAVGEVSRRLKQIALEFDLVVLVAAQLGRDAYDIEPQLRHLRESANIEQDADMVLLLWRTQQDALNCKVAKNRDGLTGTVPLSHDFARFRIGDCEPRGPAAPILE